MYTYIIQRLARNNYNSGDKFLFSLSKTVTSKYYLKTLINKCKSAQYHTLRMSGNWGNTLTMVNHRGVKIFKRG